jgi:glycerol-3-phosphate O-acyltransferase
MARPLLKTQRQVAKGQLFRRERDLRRLAVQEVSAAIRGQRRETRREDEDARRKARSQAHEIGSTLESFLFWLSFIFFRVIRIILAAALEAVLTSVSLDVPRDY